VKLFLDINVILDVLANRQPWVDDSAAVLSFLEEEDAEGYIAAHSVTTLHYLTNKHLGAKKARTALLDVLKLVSVATVDEAAVLKALSLAWPDLEDAVQAVCAIAVEADYLITRDTADYPGLSITVLTPSDFLALVRTAAEESAKAQTPRRRRS
jgi:predicted nucleic acid-binding protein